jgi:acetyl-CoA carboxylase biotin carboxyl carrier protein
VTHQQKDGSGSKPVDLSDFVSRRLSAVSEAFAAGPLMQLRVTVRGASFTLVKKGAPDRAGQHIEIIDRRHAGRLPHAMLTDGEPGRAYETVCADVVGVFHSAPDLPAPGDAIEADRVLGDIEALKLRTPVRAGFAGRFVGQVVEDGQPVDFGETLFVIDGGPAEVLAEPPVEELEPPRI